MSSQVHMALDQTFILAIANNPDGDSARLIYADWLEKCHLFVAARHD